uniref:methyltransferase domain-containing protein n=1 Tax=Amycolatopsis sp. CA-096443 TaxID=3239919 RepID=UPI003F493476
MTAGAPDWAAVLEQVPRAGFVPDAIWVDDPDGPGFAAVSRRADPGRWSAAVAADAPVITQINRGGPRSAADGDFPSSSCSQPSVVADMLNALDLRPGARVLEIGTGTGWNAALLARRVGPAGRVTTIEVDPGVADGARRALAAAGVAAEIVVGDGVHGWAESAPYDRIVATASVRELVPREWLAQLRPGGRLVAPWGTDHGNGALLTLDLGPRAPRRAGSPGTRRSCGSAANGAACSGGSPARTPSPARPPPRPTSAATTWT